MANAAHKTSGVPEHWDEEMRGQKLPEDKRAVQTPVIDMTLYFSQDLTRTASEFKRKTSSLDPSAQLSQETPVEGRMLSLTPESSWPLVSHRCIGSCDYEKRPGPQRTEWCQESQPYN